MAKRSFIFLLLFCLTANCFGVTFPDVPQNHWAYQSIQRAVDLGILKGYGGKFWGKRTVTRYEMAAAVRNLLDALDKHPKELTQPLRQDAKALSAEFAAELSLMDKRLSAVESSVETVKALEDRIALLEAQKKEHNEAQKGNLTGNWKNGVKIQNDDKSVKLSLKGRVQTDFFLPNQSTEVENLVGVYDDTVEMRRAEFGLGGTFDDTISFSVEYGWEEGVVRATDVFLGFLDTGLGDILIGHSKVPIGLEWTESNKFTTFMERGLPVEAFGPGRDTGIVLHNRNHRSKWSAGLFYESNGLGNDLSSDLGFAARYVVTPQFEDKGRNMVHIGASYLGRHEARDDARFRTRPEPHASPRYVDTGTFAAGKTKTFAFEGAIVRGPTSFQMEYYRKSVSESAGSPEFDGYYAYVSHFLTGENRSYKKQTAAFSRVKPKENYKGKKGGRGAWELALRYSSVDLNDGPITGGAMDDITFGVNWYLNPNSRVMFNYVHSDLDDVGTSNICQMRFAFDI